MVSPIHPAFFYEKQEEVALKKEFWYNAIMKMSKKSSTLNGVMEKYI